MERVEGNFNEEKHLELLLYLFNPRTQIGSSRLPRGASLLHPYFQRLFRLPLPLLFFLSLSLPLFPSSSSSLPLLREASSEAARCTNGDHCLARA